MRKSHSGSRDESSGKNPRPELVALLKQLHALDQTRLAAHSSSEGERESIPNEKALVKILDELWKEGKGRDKAKQYMGEQAWLEEALFSFIKRDDHPELAISAANLIRNVTVNDAIKLRYCARLSEILDTLRESTVDDVRVALVAVLWNLSASAPNRTLMRKHGILNILATLLPEEGAMQRETLGATNNFALDDENLEEFASSGVVAALMKVLQSPLLDGSNLYNCLSSLHKLALCPANLKLMCTAEGATALARLFKRVVVRQSDDARMLLELLAMCSAHTAAQKAMSKEGIEYLLVPIINAAIEGVSDCAEKLFKDLIGKDQRKKEALETAIALTAALKQNASYATQQLNLVVPQFDVHEKDIVIKKKVGQGAYGAVYLAEMYHGYPVACKIIKDGLDTANVNKVLDEIVLLRKLRHPNIVLLMGACKNSKNQIMIVTEYAARGDLHHSVKQVDSLELRCQMVRQVLQGMLWLTANGILHRDLKLDNLLVTQDWQVKITDFGLSIKASEGLGYDKFGGNIKFSAPEILVERAKTVAPGTKKSYAYCEASEVYSVGLIVFQILTKTTPFADRPEKYKGREGLAQYVIEGNRPPLPNDWPASLKNCVASCWSETPTQRPTFRALNAQWPDLTLDILVPDTLGRRVCDVLWSDHAAKPDYLKVRKVFLRECTHSREISPKQDQLLRSFLTDGELSAVTFERFCLTVGWFGPLDKPSNCFMFLQRMKQLSSLPFFHGYCALYLSDHILKRFWESRTNNKAPRFHVILSRDKIGEFLIRKIDSQGNITQISILNRNGYLELESGEKYETWKKFAKNTKQYGYYISRDELLYANAI